MKFLSPEVALYLYKSTIWNTIVMSGLVLLVATWNCWISYKNGYTRLLVLYLLPVLNHWLIISKCSQPKSSIGLTLVGVYLNCLKWFHFLILEGGILVILIDWMIFLSPFLDVTRMSMSIVSFLAQLNSGILCL